MDSLPVHKYPSSSNVSSPSSFTVSYLYRLTIILSLFVCTTLLITSPPSIFGIIYALTQQNTLIHGILRPGMNPNTVGDTITHKHEPDRLIPPEAASWQNLRPGEHCLRYATREYTARLYIPGSVVDNIPSNRLSKFSFAKAGANEAPATDDGKDMLDRETMMHLCRDTPVKIHGKELYTDFCQDLGFGRGVYGFWSVDFEEEDCETRWGEFINLGCVLRTDGDSGHSMRVEAHLENLQPGSSPQIMCATTPADIRGRHFGGPRECLILPTSETYGIWDLNGVSCDGS